MISVCATRWRYALIAAWIIKTFSDFDIGITLSTWGVRPLTLSTWRVRPLTLSTWGVRPLASLKRAIPSVINSKRPCLSWVGMVPRRSVLAAFATLTAACKYLPFYDAASPIWMTAFVSFGYNSVISGMMGHCTQTKTKTKTYLIILYKYSVQLWYTTRGH